jgi:HEAT repeat protein
MNAVLRPHRLRTSIVFFLALGFGLGLTTGGQEKISASARAAVVLAKFPAESAAARDAAAAELLALGPEGLQAVCRRLAAPGSDDDSLARFALDAAVVYAARPGAESERQGLVKELLRALEAPREPEVKEFLLGELQLVGKGEVVRPVSALLADPRLAGPAVRVLAAVATPEAERALLRALGTAPRSAAPAIVQALGDMRSAAAVKSLLPLAGSSDAGLRHAAEAALANIGDPAAQAVLEKTAVTVSSLERSRAAALYLLFARRLWESGKGEQAARICRDFVGAFSLPGESQVRSAALTLLSKIQGSAILDLLLEAAESGDPSFRRKALDLAIAIPGEPVTARLVEAAFKAAPEAQADIVDALGRRGDKSALRAVRERLGSGEKAVRLAAVAAAARLGGADILEEIWPLMATDDADQVRAVKSVLLGFPADLVVPRAAAMLPDAPPKAKAALIEILVERRAAGQAAAVLAQARNEDDAVRKAALVALETLARSEDVPRIIELLQASTAAPEIALLQNALAAAANASADPERRAEPVLAALDKTRAAKRGDLIRPLARIGGEKALRLVAEKLGDADPQIRAAALYALSNWKDAAALDELFKAAQSGPDRRTRYMALQGIARLAGTAGLGDERQLAVLRSALKIAVENDEKNLVLAAFGNVRNLESLRTLSRSIDAPASQARAAQAVLRAVLPAPGNAGMTGFEAAVILKKALIHIGDEYDRDQAEAYARKILFQEGFSGLFNGKDLTGWKGLVADPPQRAKMAAPALKKARTEADALMRAHWKVVDGMLLFDGKGHSLCTSRDYADFEMFVDWKIEPKGDSGIYLRGSPQVQIWDQTQSPDGSGGLYNNQIHPAKPLVRADRPIGEWNTFYVRMTGERVTVQLNGVLVTDNVVMENYWERGKPIYPSGQIELQAHSTPLRFRNIYIREVPRTGDAVD